MSESHSMPKPTPQHALFKPFEGTFRAKVLIYMGPGEPLVTSGTMVNTFQLGGLYLHQDYSGDETGSPFPAFAGKGYWGFNPARSQFEGFWIDNASSMMQLEHGTVDAAGKVWTMFSEFVHPYSGQTVKKRTEIKLLDQDHHTMTSYMIDGTGHESRTMQIEYQRS
jgi:Protein of unknown function (DUF1579)